MNSRVSLNFPVSRETCSKSLCWLYGNVICICPMIHSVRKSVLVCVSSSMSKAGREYRIYCRQSSYFFTLISKGGSARVPGQNWDKKISLVCQTTSPALEGAQFTFLDCTHSITGPFSYIVQTYFFSYCVYLG